MSPYPHSSLCVRFSKTITATLETEVIHLQNPPTVSSSLCKALREPYRNFRRTQPASPRCPAPQPRYADALPVPSRPLGGPPYRWPLMPVLPGLRPDSQAVSREAATTKLFRWIASLTPWQTLLRLWVPRSHLVPFSEIRAEGDWFTFRCLGAFGPSTGGHGALLEIMF